MSLRAARPDPETESPVIPDYAKGCISNLAPALMAEERPTWLPAPVQSARQVVLFLLDGLGWEQLRARPSVAPTLSAMVGGPITTVAPSTTATALTSLSQGCSPSEHGVVGYRLRVDGDQILNLLRWTVASVDARQTMPPRTFLGRLPFGGEQPPVVTRYEFADTGFTALHLYGVRLHGWKMPSSIPIEAAGLATSGEPFVYSYYDGIDKVAHAHGLGEHYEAELAAADGLVAAMLDRLPQGTALVVTADHGQVEVGDRALAVDPEVAAATRLMSGEGRFRWLHARPGASGALYEAARQAHGHHAWVRTLEQIEDEGWFGGRLSASARSMVGDVALAARDRVSFLDPADPGEATLVSRHGSLTAAEMLVPLLAAAA